MPLDLWTKSYLENFSGNCPNCGSALTSERTTCPRCSEPIVLGTKVLEPYLLAWGIALGAAGIMAGFGLFVLYVMFNRDSFNPHETAINFAISILGVVMSLATILLLSLRRAFCRWPTILQWLLALVLVLLTLAMAISFGLVIH